MILVTRMVVCHHAHRLDHFGPGGFELLIKCGTRFRQGEIFSGRPALTFYPAVRQEACVFEAGEQGVEGSFEEGDPGGFHFFNDIARVSFSAADDGEDAEFEHPFSHLAFCVFYVHINRILLL